MESDDKNIQETLTMLTRHSIECARGTGKANAFWAIAAVIGMGFLIAEDFAIQVWRDASMTDAKFRT